MSTSSLPSVQLSMVQPDQLRCTKIETNENISGTISVQTSGKTSTNTAGVSKMHALDRGFIIKREKAERARESCAMVMGLDVLGSIHYTSLPICEPPSLSLSLSHTHTRILDPHYFWCATVSTAAQGYACIRI